jgi:hypothetical protein
MLDRFKSEVLDPSYVTPPVRYHTVRSALEYENDDRSYAHCGDDDCNNNRRKKKNNYLLPGTHKHLGGAYDPTDGCIYGVPANAKSVLCLHYVPMSNDNDGDDAAAKKEGAVGEYRMKHIPLPPRVASTRFKWLRGIFAHGYMFAIPSWADCVLCVDVDRYWGKRRREGEERKTAGGEGDAADSSEDEEIVQLIDLPAGHKPNIWQWHGAGISPDKSAIYCIPSNAEQVLKVDLLSKTTSYIPVQFDPARYPDFDLSLTNKWYGGILGHDGCVYGIPYRASAVLQIDTRRDSARMIGPQYGSSKYYWHGGINVSGRIYAHPSHANTVLVIDTNHDPDETRIDELPIRHHHDVDDHPAPSGTDRQTYKWLGGVVGVDGNIYCPACDTTAALMIDTKSGACETFGFCGESRNKWQGGVLSPRDGSIYCIPASGRQVLRIFTGTSPPVLQLIGDLPAHKDKWQGGHVGLDGCLYFIPENGYRVMKVTPPLEPPLVVDGKLPENDVRIEFL